MSELQLFLVEPDGIRPLPVPPDATGFHELYEGLELGVYSALRTYEQNKFLGLDDHIKRTVQSMALLGWDYQLDETVLRCGLHAACAAFGQPQARVRFDILAQPLHQFNSTSRILIALKPFAGIPPHYYTDGVAVDYAVSLHRENPLAKTADFAKAREAYALGTAALYERLLLDDEGRILECTGSNFLAVRNGVVYTAGSGVLEGITLKIILSLLADLEIPLCLESVHKDEIGTLDEAGLCSSSRALIPIVRIGEQVVGNGRPGPISRRILTAYHAYVAQHIQTAVFEHDDCPGWMIVHN